MYSTRRYLFYNKFEIHWFQHREKSGIRIQSFSDCVQDRFFFRIQIEFSETLLAFINL